MVVGALEHALYERGGKLSGREIAFLCPWHDENDASCRWNIEKKLFYCHGCGVGGGENKLREKLGLETVDDGRKPPPGWPSGIPNYMKGAPVVTYDYKSLDGSEILGYVARSDPTSGKMILPFFKRDGGRWKAGAAEKPRPIYNQQRLAKHTDQRVYIVEGEKCVDMLSRERLLAVTNPGGSKAWMTVDWSILRGREIVIWPDNDEPGIKFAFSVANELSRHDTKAKIINPKELDLKSGGDVVDWLSKNGRNRESVLELPTLTVNQFKNKLKKHKRTSGVPPSITGLHELTDLGNAERMLDRHGKNLRFASGLGWMCWEENKWVRDPDALLAREYAAQTARAIREESTLCRSAEQFQEVAKHATKSEHSSRIRAMVDLLAPKVRANPAAFDAEDWIINTHSGILDVRTGEIHAHSRESMCSMITNVAFEQGADAPRWKRFLEEVIPDTETREYLQRLFGSCLTGIAKDRNLSLFVGTGHNGKGVMIETIAWVLGEYAHAVTQRFIARRSTDPVPPHELAQLPGKRFVYGAELKPDITMDVEMIKSLTGGDTIQACHKYQAPFSFKPKCKIVVSANHRPPIKDQTASIWDRLRIVKFPNQFERGKNRDNTLPEKLKQEGPGILNWMVEGALSWQEKGLGSAIAIELETEDERQEQDPLNDFFRDVVMLQEGASVGVIDVYEAYKDWADKEGYKRPWTKSKLSRTLKERPGVTQKRTASKRMWSGIAMRDERGLPRVQDMPSQEGLGFDQEQPDTEY